MKNIRDFLDRIRYLIRLKSSISDIYPCKYMKIKIDSDDDIPLEKMFIIHNLVILIKP